jgi:hypothetical protein
VTIHTVEIIFISMFSVGVYCFGYKRAKIDAYNSYYPRIEQLHVLYDNCIKAVMRN